MELLDVCLFLVVVDNIVVAGHINFILRGRLLLIYFLISIYRKLFELLATILIAVFTMLRVFVLMLLVFDLILMVISESFVGILIVFLNRVGIVSILLIFYFMQALIMIIINTNLSIFIYIFY